MKTLGVGYSRRNIGLKTCHYHLINILLGPLTSSLDFLIASPSPPGISDDVSCMEVLSANPLDRHLSHLVYRGYKHNLPSLLLFDYLFSRILEIMTNS